MTFTIYTMGDLQIFWSVLNAVAMVFQSSMFDPTKGAGAFVLGGLISLFFIIVPPMMGKKMDLIPMFFVFIIFFAGIVPKARVQIEDVYTGTVTAVDNVPMIVAFPGAVAGLASKAITDKVETAFSTSSGSYLSMGAEGFANPLKLLLSFRGSNNVPSPFPYLTQSTMDFVRYCAIPASNFDIKALNASTDVYGTYFPNLAVSGITTYYNAANPNGYGMSCTLAQAQLAADAMLATTPANLNPIVKAQLENGVQSTTGAGPTALGITNAYDMAIAGTGIGQSAQQFMMNAIAKEPIEKGVTCATASISNLTACQQAVLIKVAQEKQAIDSAASATIFTKTIIPAMNILLALFYAFSPILLAVALMSAGHGVKIIMGFLLFGVWTQSWMPIAAVINYMIELQTNYEVHRFAAANGITPGNIWQFYDTVRTKIGLASELLAMTPMISFGLLSGSMMALTGISQKFGARDYVSEGNVAPDVLKVDPVTAVAPIRKGMPQTEYNPNTGITNQVGVGSNVSFGGSSQVSNSLAHADQLVNTAQTNLSTSLDDAVMQKYGTNSTAEAYAQQQKDVAQSNNKLASLSQNYVAQSTTGMGLSQDQRNVLEGKFSAGLEAGLSVDDAAKAVSDEAKKMKGLSPRAGAKIGASGGISGSTTAAEQQNYQENETIAVQQARQAVESLTSTKKDANGKTVKNSAALTTDNSLSKKIASAKSELDAATSSDQAAHTAVNSHAMSVTQDQFQFGNGLASNKSAYGQQTRDELDRYAQAHGSDVTAIMNGALGGWKTDGDTTMAENKRRVAAAMLAEKNGQDGLYVSSLAAAQGFDTGGVVAGQDDTSDKVMAKQNDIHNDLAPDVAQLQKDQDAAHATLEKAMHEGFHKPTGHSVAIPGLGHITGYVPGVGVVGEGKDGKPFMATLKDIEAGNVRSGVGDNIQRQVMSYKSREAFRKIKDGEFGTLNSAMNKDSASVLGDTPTEKGNLTYQNNAGQMAKEIATDARQRAIDGTSDFLLHADQGLRKLFHMNG